MKSKKTLFALLFVGIVMLFSASASIAQDTTKSDDAMKKDEMKKDDGMKKDAMMKDDGMKKDDAMMKDDGMKKDDAMMKDDGMKKDAMMKDDAMAMKDDAMMMKDDHRPIVASIEADWCPYCKRVDPVLAALKKDYSEKFNFISFDVTDAKAIAASKAKAEKLGMSEFFDKFKEKTSAVVVMKDKKIVYKTYNNDKKADYVKAFDAAATK